MNLPKWMFKQMCGSLNRLHLPNYKAYLGSVHWAQIVTLLRKSVCQRCNKRKSKLTLHHNNYTCLGKETAADVLTLCEGCHDKEHEALLSGTSVAIPQRNKPKPIRGQRKLFKEKRYPAGAYLPKIVKPKVQVKKVPAKPTGFTPKCKECCCYEMPQRMVDGRCSKCVSKFSV